MKKQIAGMLMVWVFTGTAVSAQPQAKPPGMEERIQHVSERMEKELQLSASQKTKLAEAYKDFFTEIEKERKKEGNLKEPPPPPPPPVRKEVAEKLSMARDAKIKSVLTETQYQKYTAIEKTMRPPMPPGKPGEGKLPNPDKKQ